MSERISVIIPLYNKGPFIARALDSILKQTNQNFEIIVVDDGSTDSGPNIVRTFSDPRIRLIQQENGGVSVARNRGIETAKADLIAFLDADDEWLPDHLSILLELREKYPEAGLFATKFIIKEKSGQLKEMKNHLLSIKHGDGLINRYFLVAALSEPLIVSAVGILRKKLIEFGGFPENVQYGEDMLLWGRIALQYPIAYSCRIGAIYHQDYNNGISQNLEYQCLSYPFIDYGKTILENSQLNPQLRKDLEEYIARKELNRGYAVFIQGKRDTAKEIVASVKTNYFYREKIFLQILFKLPVPIYNSLKSLKNFVVVQRERKP